MKGAMAFLAGMGTGYLNGEKEKDKQKRQDKLDAQRDELHEAQMAEKKQAVDDRTALKYAGETVTARPLDGPQPESAYVDGQEPTQPIGYISGNGASARTFAGTGVGQEQAQANAVQQNKPEARRTRMADLAAQGNTLAGTALANSMSTEASQMALDKGRREEANRVFDNGIRTSLQTGGPAALADFMSKSTADGQGGAVKFQAVIAPDNKTWQMHQVGPDGTTKPVGQSFSNDENGFATAGFMLSRAVPESEKVKHLLDVKETERKAKHDEGVLKIQQQNADTQERWRKDQARINEEHNKLIAEGKRQTGAPVQISIKDMRDFEGDLTSAIKDQFPVAQGTDAAERATLNAQATTIKALGTSMFRTNAAIGNPLTAGTVMQAMEIAKNPKNIRGVEINGNTYESVVVNGQPVITSGAMVKKPAEPVAAPGAKAPVTPAAVARGGVAQPAALEAPQFNAAGYVSVQSTIDGAKRGDARARALLNDLINQGVTTPAERNQIAQLPK